ncbi:MAG: hypothetical protein OXQ92_08400 [Boseongicola sp.]|nr:hypothetical protein [Boseongicola sp.]
MSVSINETPGANYTWAAAGFSWNAAEGGKSWASAHTTVFDVAASETMPMAGLAGRSANIAKGSAIGLGDHRKAISIANRLQAFALAETYVDYINFILSVTENLILGEISAKASSRPEDEAFALGDDRRSLSAQEMAEPLSVSEANQAITAFWRDLSEAFGLDKVEAKHSGRVSDETLGLAGALLRHANAVMADLALRSGPLDEAAFRAMVADKAPLGYGRFRDLAPGDYEYAKAIIGLRLSAPVTGERIAISNAVLNVDVPDVRDRGTASVPVGGVEIAFNRSFAEPPEVQVTLKAGGAPSLPEVLSITTSSFTVRLLDAADGVTPVAGTVSWSALGY